MEEEVHQGTGRPPAVNESDYGRSARRYRGPCGVNECNRDITTAIPRALARAWAFRHPRSALANARSKSHRLL